MEPGHEWGSKPTLRRRLRFSNVEFKEDSAPFCASRCRRGTRCLTRGLAGLRGSERRGAADRPNSCAPSLGDCRPVDLDRRGVGRRRDRLHFVRDTLAAALLGFPSRNRRRSLVVIATSVRVRRLTRATAKHFGGRSRCATSYCGMVLGDENRVSRGLHEAGGGPPTRHPVGKPALASSLKSHTYEVANDCSRPNLGTVAGAALRHARTGSGNFNRILGILEAPPGFEPGMEVLQTGPKHLCC
jgi:hypothetical protein